MDLKGRKFRDLSRSKTQIVKVLSKSSQEDLLAEPRFLEIDIFAFSQNWILEFESDT